jgi:hypothetical protein
MIGGSAFDSSDWNQESETSAFLMKNASFDDVMKLIKTSISKSAELDG